MFGISAATAAVVAGVGGAVVGGVMSNKAASKTADAQRDSTNASIEAQKEAAKLDPRIDPLIYGDRGVVNRAYGLLDSPTSTGTSQFQSGVNSFMGGQGMDALNSAYSGAQGLMDSNIMSPFVQGAAQVAAPTDMQAATARPSATMSAATVGDVGSMKTATVGDAPNIKATGAEVAGIDAPNQNKLDLTSAYEHFINGNPAENKYLTDALQGGINQSKNAFDRMQTDATENLQKNILPSIRSNSILAGQYGGSRQGIAEGNAIGQFGKEMARASSDYGQRNTDAVVGAQANAFESGQNRALSATTGLGAEQYGVAKQASSQAQQAALASAQMQQQATLAEADMKNQRDMQNAGWKQQGLGADFQAQQQNAQQNAGYQQQANAANYSGLLGADMANAGFQQQANATNYAGTNNASQFNAGNVQQSSLANLNSQMSTNSLNSANRNAGVGLTSGLLGQTYGYQQNADNSALNRVGQVSGLLQPYANKGSVNVPMSQPVYNNTAAGALGGATAGLGLYNAYNQATASPYMSGGVNTAVNAPYNSTAYFNTANYAK